MSVGILDSVAEQLTPGTAGILLVGWLVGWLVGLLNWWMVG
jgi:hypothetical protein